MHMKIGTHAFGIILRKSKNFKEFDPYSRSATEVTNKKWFISIRLIYCRL